MAAPKGKEAKEKLFKEIIIDIAVEGKSLRTALIDRLSSETFYAMIDKDIEKSKQYARACDERAEREFEDILDIADNSGNDKKTVDGNEVTNHEAIQRDRLRVDARKWRLSKMMPKKYGDKIDVTSGDEKINSASNILLKVNGKDISLK